MKNKRFLSAVLCLVLVASLFTGIVSTASAEDVITYTVKNGDYLLKICKSLGLDYYQCKNAIMILNSFTSDVQLNQLTVGRVIKLPATNAIAATVTGSSSTTTTVATSTTVNGVTTTTTSSSTVNGVQSSYSVAYYLIPHVVKSGETLAGICNTYGTTYAQYANIILAVNGFSSPNYVWAGKTVYIPSSKAPSAGSCYAVVAHTVKSGETLTSICSAYGTSYAANSKMVNGLNYGKNLATIYVGQTIYIPVVATVNASTASASSASTVVETGYYIDFETSVYTAGKGSTTNTTVGSPYAVVNDTYVSRADIGKTVTIVPNPKYGYAQKSVGVYRSDNSADIIVKNNTFVMPACDVVIDVEYQEAYSITKTPTQFGTIDTLVNGVEADWALANDTVVLSFATDYGYTCEDAYYVNANGVRVDITQSKDGTWSFVMPNGKVTVYATFAKGGNLQNQKITTDLRLYSNADEKYLTDTYEDSATVSYVVSGSACTQAAAGTQVTAVVKPNTDYAIEAVSVKDTNNKPITVTKQDNTHYTFMMPSGGVTVTVYTYYDVWWKLTDASGNGGKIIFTNSYGEVINYAQVDDEVHVLFKPYSGYVYERDTLLVTYQNGNSQISAKKTYENVYNEFEFTMVDADVSATVTWSEDSSTQNNIYMASCSNGDYDIWVTPPDGTASRSSYAMVGETVTVYVYGNTGYICTGLYACREDTNEPVLDSSETGPWTITMSDTNSAAIASGSFVMPEKGKIRVTATFKAQKQYVNIVNYGENYDKEDGFAAAYIKDNLVDNALVGSQIEIYVYPYEGYSLAALYLYCGNDEYFTSLSVNDDTAYYTISKYDYNSDPEKNYIEIIPEFEASTLYTVNNVGSGYSVSPETTTVGKYTQITLKANDGLVFSENPFTDHDEDDYDQFALYSGTESDGSREDFQQGNELRDYYYVLSEDLRTITFWMPADNVYVNARTEAASPRTITYTGGHYTANVTAASKGEEVVLTATDGNLFSGMSIVDTVGNPVEWEISEDRLTVTFRMPDTEVTVNGETVAVEEYKINYYGSGYSSTSGTKETAGTAVTLTADAGKCFVESDIKIYSCDDSGNQIPDADPVAWTLSEDHTVLTFYMPYTNVNVGVDGGNTITCYGLDYTPYYGISRNGGTAVTATNLVEAKAGDEITLIPTDGSSFSQVISLAAYKNGTKHYEIDYTHNSDQGTITFTMPEYDVVISAELGETWYKVVKVSMAGGNTGYSVYPSTVSAGDIVELTADPGVIFKGEISICKVNDDGSSGEKITDYVLSTDKGKVTFIMPTSSVVVDAQVVDEETTTMQYHVSAAGLTESFTISQSEAAPETQITLTAVIGSFKNKSIVIERADHTTVDYHMSHDHKTATFTMPAFDVTVTVTAVSANTIALSGAGFTASGKTAAAGETVTLTVDNGKQFIKEKESDIEITCGGSNVSYTMSSDNTTITFVMPDGDVTVIANAGYPVNCYGTGYTVDHKVQLPGEKVELSADAGLQFTKVTNLYSLKGEEKDQDVAYTMDVYKTGIIFTMPDAPVNVGAETEAKQTYTVTAYGENYTATPTSATSETVVTLAPSAGYTALTITNLYAVGEGGGETALDYTANSDGTITFAMPAANVNVGAEVTAVG